MVLLGKKKQFNDLIDYLLDKEMSFIKAVSYIFIFIYMSFYFILICCLLPLFSPMPPPHLQLAPSLSFTSFNIFSPHYDL